MQRFWTEQETFCNNFSMGKETSCNDFGRNKKPSAVDFETMSFSREGVHPSTVTERTTQIPLAGRVCIRAL